MKRFFKELFSPILKCNRIGHKFTTDKIVIRKDDKSMMHVAVDYDAERRRCVRCGHCDEPENLQYFQGYNSCSMPDRMWREIRRKGYTILKVN